LGLRGYIIKRILYSIFLVFFVITLNFIIFMLMPGNPMMRLANPSRFANAEQYEEQLRRFGLLDPPLVKYGKYIQNMLTFQFGYSYTTNSPVVTEMTTRLLNTLVLSISCEVLSIILGIAIGVIAAHKRGGIFDTLAVGFSIVTNALPVFWVGMLLLLVFSFNLGWFPIGFTYPPEWAFPGRWPTNPLVEIQVRLWHLFLPTLALVIILIGSYILITRASMLEVLSEDYLVTAKAKGVSQRKVLFKHAFKNASLPLITQIAIAFGFTLSGAIVTETVFSYPGFGLLIWMAIEKLDYPMLQAIFFIIGLCVIAANFLADLVYGMVDPRIKYE